MSKYGHRPINWFEAIVNKLGGEAKAEEFLRGEIMVSEPPHKWREEDGVIYFSVTSDGTTGEEWIRRLNSKCFWVGSCANSALRSPDFKPTSGVTTEVAVFKGILFEDKDRIMKKIRAEADKRKLEKPNAEISCLICEKFTSQEFEAMGFQWIIAVHELINDSNGDPHLLGVSRGNGDHCWLGSCYYDLKSHRWDREDGFAFAVSQV